MIQPGRIMIVDDEFLNRELLWALLEALEHEVIEAENGFQALEQIGDNIDVVICDMMMPGMTGLQVLERIKGDPAHRHIPIIMLSAVDEIETVAKCIQAGADDYLSKPLNPMLLRARLGACLEKKRWRDQEVEYLNNVAIVTQFAAQVEGGEFDPEGLSAVAGRDDELGGLARVFQRMAREVRSREQQLKSEVQQLRIEIDQVKRERMVSEITDTDFFQELQARAREMRRPGSGS